MQDKKHDLPAMPFYWGDWFKASDVQMIPREIRCTWLEMLGRMWESKERGYLSVNGEPLNDQELAQLLGFGNDIETCKKHIDFLEKKGIFSRTKTGIIYNRRMVNDVKLSKKRAFAGKKGMKIRYNKTPNKPLTNTEDENEDEIEDEIEDVSENKIEKFQGDFIDELIHIFSVEYQNHFNIPYVVTNEGKERTAVGHLLGAYNKKNKGADSQKCKNDLRSLFKAIITADYSKERYLSKLTLPKINSDLNQYMQLIKQNREGQGVGSILD